MQPARTHTAEPPGQGTPAQGTPAQGTSAQGTSAQLTPAQLTPAQLTPAQGMPAQTKPANATARAGPRRALAALITAVTALSLAAPLLAPSAAQAFSLCPQKVSRAVWAHGWAGWTLKVYPSVCGRLTAAVDPRAVFDQAIDTAAAPAGEPARWDPDAGSMYEQFRCHAWGAQIVDPTKPSWNLDTWRPLVSWSTEIRYACNPPAGAR